jgi:hypothetical protein
VGTLSNLYTLLTDSSFRKVEEEASKELVIAVAGNHAEARDKLLNALSSRVESLWTPNPFRVIDINYFPTLQEQVDTGGLVLFALYSGERMSQDQQNWLKDLAASDKAKILVTVLPKQTETKKNPRPTRRFQVINPLRFSTTGENTQSPSADGAGAVRTGEVKAGWEIELENLPDEKGNLKVVNLSGLELSELENELLPAIVSSLPGFELALARRAPIFRNAVAGHFVTETARDNAQVVLLANIFAGVPFIGGVFGGGADFLILTQNQFALANRLAAVYGQKRNTRVEMYLEFAPIIVSGLVWRGLSRYLIRKTPSLLVFIPKIGIAFAATWLVGQIARWYYADGRVASTQLANFSRNLYERLTNQSGKSADNAGGDSGLNQKSS